jgi:DNA-binding protein Fis
LNEIKDISSITGGKFGVNPVDNLESPLQTIPQAKPAAIKEQSDSVNGAQKAELSTPIDGDLASRLDKYSLESIVEAKICRFLDQIGTYYPEDLHDLIIKKVEKPLLSQILRRTGGNQVHASKILGINRNTLRKKMKMYGF